MEDGAAGYAVVWKRGVSWAGIKTHMGYSHEAYDAECAALARVLEEAARTNSTPERVTIFSDAQAVIEIRWCRAHKGVAGNEMADEWAKIAAEEPDTHGVEWLNYSDRTEVQEMPLPRPLANLKREISEKK